MSDIHRRSEALAALAREQLTGAHRDDAFERDRFVQSITKPAPSRRPLFLAAAAALALAVAALVWWPATGLDYEIQGAASHAQGYVRAEEGEATIAFSDGSTIRLESGSASRVVDTNSKGARLLLERGRAWVSIEQRASSRWSVAAGPYVVDVTGTRFSVAWTPERGRFELTLHEGSVMVRGPLTGEGLRVEAGQHVLADDSDLKIQAPQKQAGAIGHEPFEAQVAPAPEPAATQPDPGVMPPRTPAPPPTRSWAQMVADGDYAEVLAQADAQGIEGALRGSSVGELVALSDAARYGGRTTLARRSLEQVRSRFPGQSAASTAAFLLGRMSEGSPATAMRWYDRYLGEAPGGAYAAEALGRKLVLTSRSDERQARALAKQYLSVYPRGAYAEHARALIR